MEAQSSQYLLGGRILASRSLRIQSVTAITVFTRWESHTDVARLSVSQSGGRYPDMAGACEREWSDGSST